MDRNQLLRIAQGATVERRKVLYFVSNDASGRPVVTGAVYTSAKNDISIIDCDVQIIDKQAIRDQITKILKR